MDKEEQNYLTVLYVASYQFYWHIQEVYWHGLRTITVYDLLQLDLEDIAWTGNLDYSAVEVARIGTSDLLLKQLELWI